jgi:hypothetical protein
MSNIDESHLNREMLRNLQQGKFTEAARLGEIQAVRSANTKFSASFYSLLAASHLANGSFPAARLAVVRGVAELQDKSLDFLARLLDARNRNRYNDAVNALKSAPEDVRSIFQDILICELAATTAAAYKPASVGIVVEVSELGIDEVKASLKRMGNGFGVVLEESSSSNGSVLRRVTAAQDQKNTTSSSSNDKNNDGKRATIASVKLVTDASLMTAQPVDRYWK